MGEPEDGERTQAEGGRAPARRWLRRMLWGVGGGVAALCVLLVVVPPLLPEGLVGRMVARRLSKALAREATVEGARFSFFSGLRAWGICMREREGFGEGDFLRIGKLVVATSPFGLLTNARPREVRIEDVDLHLVCDEQGVWSTEDFVGRGLPEAPSDRLVASNVRIHVRDARSGTTQIVELASVDLGPPVARKRRLAVTAKPASGGEWSLAGDVWVPPDDEVFDRAELRLEARSVPLGQPNASRPPRAPVGAPSHAPLLDADVELAVSAEHIFKANGTARLRGLPEVPQAGFTGPARAAVLSLSGEWSSANPHFDLSLATQPGEAIRVTASLRRAVADGSLPAFLLDNYLLEVQATALADFSKGALPGSRLVAGRGSLSASARGTLGDLRAELSAALDGGQVRLPDGSLAPVPRLSLEAEGWASLLDFCGRLTRLSLTTEGASVTCAADARPVPGARVAIGPDGSLPPIVAKGELTANADFARWPRGLAALAGLPSRRPLEGTLTARGELDLDGGQPHTLHVEVDGLPLDQDSELAARLPLLDLINVLVGGRPERVEVAATLKADFRAQGLSPRQLSATLTGRGDLRLGKLHVVGSPLFALLAATTGHPQFRDVTFERADAPFTLAAGRIESAVTLPYQEGALVFRGHCTLGGPVEYEMHVRNPRGIRFASPELLEYLEADLPLMLITGTTAAPVYRVPTEAILQFSLQRKLEKALERPRE